MADKKPLVSVIVPVYNSESFLHRCMDSLVNQSLKDIEIITVNNESTDNSLEILESYAEKYPNVRVISIPHQDRAGYGRNLGIKEAKADYIGFCDSDDVFDLYAFEKLYECAIEHKSDLVVSPFYHVVDGDAKQVYKFDEKVSVEDIIIRGNYALWNKLYKKSLLLKSGFMPTDFCFEDFAYFPVVASYAKKISYMPDPTYYYITRSESEVNAPKSIRMLDPMKAVDYNQKHCNPKYRPVMMMAGVSRLMTALPQRWIFEDSYIRYFKDHFAEYEKNYAMYSSPGLINKISDKIDAFKNEFDSIVYISGFGKSAEEFSDYIKETAFYDGVRVEVLDENSCDVNENEVIRQAYAEGMYKLVAQYFAIKAINSTGGVFIYDDMVIDTPLNYLKHLKAVFVYENASEYNDSFFGGQADQSIFMDLLDSFTESYIYGKFATLSQRIRNLLYAKYNIPINGLTYMLKYDVSVFSALSFTYDLSNVGRFATTMHFAHKKKMSNDIAEGEVVVDAELLNIHIGMMTHAAAANASASTSAQTNIQSNQVANLTRELNEIKNSNSWKFVQKLKKFAQNPLGRFMKKVYFKLFVKK